MLSKLEQRDFYKIILERKRLPVRKRSDRNVEVIQACAQETFNIFPTTEAIWMASKHKDFTRKTRDFIWKSIQSTYKIGEFWENITGYENRGTCPLCDEKEDMEHILTKCKAKARTTAWKLANELWKQRHTSPLPNRIGDILGCGLATFKTKDKMDKGKNRLYRILISETAFLIWKMRNKRRIRDEDTPGREHSESETYNRWKHAINKRLTIDRALTNKERFRKKAINEKLVKATWRNCLQNEEDLPANWSSLKGVLVGIRVRRPVGHVR